MSLRKHFALCLALVVALVLVPRPLYAFDTYIPTLQSPTKPFDYAGVDPWPTLKDGLYKFERDGASASFFVSGNGSYASDGNFSIKSWIVADNGFPCVDIYDYFPRGAAIEGGGFRMDTTTPMGDYFRIGNALGCRITSETQADCHFFDASAAMGYGFPCGQGSATLTLVDNLPGAN